MTKRCCRCEDVLPIDHFNTDKSAKDGHQSQCRECQKKWREDNHEYLINKKKQYYETNQRLIKEQQNQYRETHKEQRRQYAENNKEYIAARTGRYYEANRECIIKRTKKYYEANREHKLEQVKRYGTNHPDKVRQRSQRRRARKLALPSTFTIDEWNVTKEHFNNCCAYCGKEKPLTQDHFYPLSKGGEYAKINIVPACQSCNSSKYDKIFSDWFPTFRLYSKKREKDIRDYLGYKKGVQQLTLA